MANSIPSVSVAICTKDRPEKVGQAVHSVLSNDYLDFDLTVVDQSTTNETEETLGSIAANDKRVHYVRMRATGLSRAYNNAVSRTTGEIIAFTDDDCIVPSDWVQSIATAFEQNSDAQLLYGQVLPCNDDYRGTPCLLIKEPERLDRRRGFRVFGMGANFAAKRSLFKHAGLFDVALGGGGRLKASQDFDLAYRTYRSGGAILLRPEVVVWHDGHRAEADWPELLFSYGFGDGAFYSKHVRCWDGHAMWLMAKAIVLPAVKSATYFALRRPNGDRYYVKGFIMGVREGLKMNVDKAKLLYSEGVAE